MKTSTEVLLHAVIALIAAVLVYALVVAPQSDWPDESPVQPAVYQHPEPLP